LSDTDPKMDTHDGGEAPAQPFGYLIETQKPLQALIFLLPLIGLYEAGLIRYGYDASHQVQLDIFARRMLEVFLTWFGIGGIALPGIIVITVLLSMHLVRGDPWRFVPRHYLFMAAESLALAMPLFVLSLVLFRAPQAAQSMVAAAPDALNDVPLMGRLVFNLGAGIYEEMVFRLVALAVLHFCLVDVVGLRERTGAILAIFISALAFAFYHFNPAQTPSIDTLTLAFRTVAGLYFASLYLVRGFGIVVGTHAIYDVLVELFQL